MHIDMQINLRSRALDKIYKRRDRYDIPDWQRSKVWSPAMKQKLIDSILRGWRLPKFYLLRTNASPEEYEVLDGQQRLAAIWEFLDNELELSEDSKCRFGGPLYRDLEDAFSDAFDDYEIDFDEIIDADEEDQKELFQRLQLGLPLTSSEKLNAVHSKLRDYCAKLAKDKFFTETSSISGKRHAFFDVCAKVLALEIEGLDSGTRFKDLETAFETNSCFSGNSAVAKRARKALTLLHKYLPKPCKALRNRTLTQSAVTLTCHLLSAGLNEKKYLNLAEFIEDFMLELTRQVELGPLATDKDYLAFQRTVNANVRNGPKIRNDILLRKLFRFDPDFFTSSSSSAGLQAGLQEQIGSSVMSIRNAVHKANEVYAAKNGKDLFKPTNKTVKALTDGIATPISDLESYKALIENLYFLFRESVGQRLGDDVPRAFTDVNDLRTLNEHDVDHGKGGKPAKKRKDLASVFRKYSGQESPQSIGPELFIVIQANILSALESAASTLANDLGGRLTN